MQPSPQQANTPAWNFFVWTAFASSILLTGIGICYIPADWWVRGYFAMGLFFSVASAFTLAKTIRDNFEAQKSLSRGYESRADHVLHDYESKNA